MYKGGKRITDFLPEDSDKLPKFSRGTVGRHSAESSSEIYAADQYFPPYKVYLSNMSRKPDDYELKNFFDSCSIVGVSIWKLRNARYTKYSGIVEFENFNDFRVALTRNNKMLCGRKINVQVSKSTNRKTPVSNLEACSKNPFVSKKQETKEEHCMDEQTNSVFHYPKKSWCELVEDEENKRNKNKKILTNPKQSTFLRNKFLSPEDLEKVSKNPPFRVYVGNIANWVDKRKLAKFFLPAIATNIKFLYKGDNRRNSATVDFEFVEDYIQALKTNGRKFETKTMIVETSGQLNKNPFATAPSDAPNWRKQNSTDGVEKVFVDLSKVPYRPPFKAHLGNLPYKAVKNDLRTFLQPVNVLKIIPLFHKDTRSSKGSAMVEFKSREDLLHGLRKSGETIFDRNIEVSVWKNKSFSKVLYSKETKNNRFKVPENPPFETIVKNFPLKAGEVDCGGYMSKRKIYVSHPRNSNRDLLIVPSNGPVDFDLLKIPKLPPFKAFVTNLPYKACQIDIENYFEPLQIVNHTPFHYDDSLKFKGSVILEFKSREDLIDGLKKGGGQMAGRQVKVAVHRSKGVDSQSNCNLKLDVNTNAEVVPRKTRQFICKLLGKIANENSQDRFGFGTKQ